MVVAFFAIISTFLFIISLYYFLGYRAEKREWKKSMESTFSKNETRTSFIVVLGERFDQTKYAQPLQARLKKANMPLTPSELFGIMIVGTMGGMFVMTNFFSIPFPLNFLFSAALLIGALYVFMLLRRNKYQERLNEQLPEVCRLLANATRSGMTLTQGLALVTQEINEPAKGEFQRVVSEIQLGTDFDRALRNLENRIPNREFKLFVAMLLIQKQAGGNLYSILHEMSNTLDERKLLLQEIKTMTSEQRYVANLLPFIPIFLLLMMNNVVDGFLDPLFSTVGVFLLIFFVISIVITFVLVRKVTNIRV